MFSNLFQRKYLNNLYGWGQSQRMPVGDYEWMTEEEIAAKDWTEYDENGTTDCIVMCDLLYPPNLHLSHSRKVLAH